MSISPAYAYTITIGSLAAAGIYNLARYKSLLRLLIGFEMLAAAAASSLVLWAGSIGFYAVIVVLDTLSASLFAAAAYIASREKKTADVDEV